MGSIGAARFGVLTVSDTRTQDDDRSGPSIEVALENVGAVQIERNLVVDEIDDIETALLDMASRCNIVFTTGGTGLGPRDVTPEATKRVADRTADGLAEYLRIRGRDQTEFAHLSRGVCAIRGSTLIVNLPGSPSGAGDGVRALAEMLPHILDQLVGGGHD